MLNGVPHRAPNKERIKLKDLLRPLSHCHSSSRAGLELNHLKIVILSFLTIRWVKGFEAITKMQSHSFSFATLNIQNRPDKNLSISKLNRTDVQSRKRKMWRRHKSQLVLYWNERVRQSRHRGAGQLRGRQWQASHHPDSLRALEPYGDHLIRDRELRLLPARHRHGSG